MDDGDSDGNVGKGSLILKSCSGIFSWIYAFSAGILFFLIKFSRVSTSLKDFVSSENICSKDFALLFDEPNVHISLIVISDVTKCTCAHVTSMSIQYICDMKS